jgi:hypothetical protein
MVLFRRVILTLFICLFPAEGLLYADSTAQITGNIQLEDGSGVGIPGASIHLIDDTGKRTTTVSNASGEYQINGLSSGRYRMVVELEGCRTSKKILEIDPGKTVSQNVTLQTGAIREEVEVTGKAQVIDSKKRPLSAIKMTAESFSKLPIELTHFPPSKKNGLPHMSIPGQIALNSGMNQGLFFQDLKPDEITTNLVVKGNPEDIEEIEMLKGLSSHISSTDKRNEWDGIINDTMTRSQETFDSKGIPRDSWDLEPWTNAMTQFVPKGISEKAPVSSVFIGDNTAYMGWSSGSDGLNVSKVDLPSGRIVGTGSACLNSLGETQVTGNAKDGIYMAFKTPGGEGRLCRFIDGDGKLDRVFREPAVNYVPDYGFDIIAVKPDTILYLYGSGGLFSGGKLKIQVWKNGKKVKAITAAKAKVKYILGSFCDGEELHVLYYDKNIRGVMCLNAPLKFILR